MAITRYESIVVNNVVNGTNDIGEYTTTITPWFNTRGLIHDVANSLRISERYRAYTDLVNITLNDTPNTREMVENQNLYSITWRGNDWRIADIREHNSRMRITFMCFRNDPEVPE